LEEVNSHGRPSSWAPSYRQFWTWASGPTPLIVTLCAAAVPHMICFAQLMQERRRSAGLMRSVIGKASATKALFDRSSQAAPFSVFPAQGRWFLTAINEINHLTQTVDQEVGGSSPPSCTK
jgi:hypothetical protein